MIEELLDITLRSVYIASSSTLLAALWSIPISMKLALSQRRGAELVFIIANALMALPTVVLGLLLFLLLSRTGPLGFLNLLFKPEGMIIGSSILVTPILISLLTPILRAEAREILESALTLGAPQLKALWKVVEELRTRIFTVLFLGFTRSIGELGVALLVGGDIRLKTRVFTTAIALETFRGNFETALQLGAVLILLVSVLSIVFVGLRLSWR